MVIHDAMKFGRVQQPWLHWDEQVLRSNVGVYVHIPFCLARCDYCDFLTYGHVRPLGLEPKAYVKTLLLEIKQRGEWVTQCYDLQGRAVDTVFVGGGTPTYLAQDQLCEIVQALRKHFKIEASAEVTVEANPDTLNSEYIKALNEVGVNRLSVGIQATQSHHLRRLNRTHRWADIQPTLQALITSNIKRYSFDIIYSLPGLSQRELKETLKRVLALSPEHVSAYELTFEQGTPITQCAKHLPRLIPNERDTVKQQRTIENILAGGGLYRYEVSNYAKPGAECKHNLRYWRGGDYYGMGLGAASRIGMTVLNNPRCWDEYSVLIEKVGAENDPYKGAWDSMSHEYRRQAPQSDAFLQARTRLGFSVSYTGIKQEWIAKGWIKPRRDGWIVTSLGMNFAESMGLELG